MKALELKGFRMNLIDVDTSMRALKELFGGTFETITLRDGGAMICDEFALAKDMPYNSLASLIAGTSVYGDALIVGADGNGFSDVPDAFYALLNFPDDYFAEGGSK